MSLQEEELVSSHAGQPEQASSLLDQIMAQTRIQPGSEGYDVARQGVTAFIASVLIHEKYEKNREDIGLFGI